MKTIIFALLALGVSYSAANAETFTFSSTSTLGDAVTAVMADGKPVTAAFLSGKSQATYASGRSTTNTFQCANWSAAPGSVFDAFGACTYVEAGGDTASIVVGCDYTAKDQSQSDCWGALSSQDGPHKGKSGTIAWHAKLNADGKTGVSTGTGQWDD